MDKINRQATALNQTLSESNSAIYELLSERGRAIFFPHTGILGQTAEAKGKKLNATIGMACEDDGTIMALDSIADLISIERDKIFPYASSFGNKALREQWQQQILKKNPSIDTAISLPIVTSAITHGLSIAGYIFVEARDAIVLAEPFWGNYKLTFSTTYGVELVPFPLFKNGGMNIEGFIETLGKIRPKMALLNFPNNPCGYTPTNKEVEQLVAGLEKYVQDNSLIVLCDDAYFGLVYEKDVFTESIFSKLCNLHENLLVIKLDGCTKEDYAWGFRVGFITFGVKNGSQELYAALEDKAAGVVRATSSNSPNISQALLLKGFTSNTYVQEKEKKRKLLQERYEEIKRILSEHKEYKQYFTPLPFNSGYFMCLQLIDSINAEATRKHLLEKYDTGLISINNMLRVAFSSVAASKLQRIFDNIYNACKEMEGK